MATTSRHGTIEIKAHIVRNDGTDVLWPAGHLGAGNPRVMKIATVQVADICDGLSGDIDDFCGTYTADGERLTAAEVGQLLDYDHDTAKRGWFDFCVALGRLYSAPGSTVTVIASAPILQLKGM